MSFWKKLFGRQDDTEAKILECPFCKQQVTADKKLAGVTVSCPNSECGREFLISAEHFSGSPTTSKTAKPSPQQSSPKFNQTKATEGLEARFASLFGEARAGTLKPQLWLRCKRTSMAIALAEWRPSSTDSYLVGPPEVVQAPDGSGAVVFRVRSGNDLLPLVQILLKGSYGNANVEVTNGLAAHLPEHQQKAMLGMFGARQGMRTGNATVW